MKLLLATAALLALTACQPARVCEYRPGVWIDDCAPERGDRPERSAAALNLDAVERLVEAAEAYKQERLKLDDTPEFCAMVAAIAAFKEAPK